jgi:hypothetical protein
VNPATDRAVLARLPLQIGTTSAWSAGRSAAALFPGFALFGTAIVMLVHLGRYDIRFVLAVGAVGALLVAYSIGHITSAVRTRASDVLLFSDGLTVDGGRLHGETIAWSDLTAPYAEIEDTTVKRITMGSILMLALSILARSSSFANGATSSVRVWRLHVHSKGERRLIAETDRAIERDSMAAAAASVSAVVSGQRYVAEAPTVATNILTCNTCGGAAVPDDASTVACAYCGGQVTVTPEARGQAAGAKATSQGRETTSGIIAKLRDQPRAEHANKGLVLLAALMFGAWPVGWGLIAFRVLADGLQPADVLCLLLPFAAVVAGFFLARARLADRGALQLLTLGFGALSPRKEGEPSRCRRCQGPLPSAGLGGVAHCRYCATENIVGLDLRPTVDATRTEQVNFDDALQKRASEKRLWTTLSVVAAFTLAGWVAGTVAYIVHIEAANRGAAHESPKSHSKAPPAPSPKGGGRR